MKSPPLVHSFPRDGRAKEKSQSRRWPPQTPPFHHRPNRWRKNVSPGDSWLLRVTPGYRGCYVGGRIPPRPPRFIHSNGQQRRHMIRRHAPAEPTDRGAPGVMMARRDKAQLSFIIEEGEARLPLDLSWLDPESPAYQCLGECGWILPKACFPLTRNNDIARRECIHCRQTREDRWKAQHRYLVKAQSALRKHMRKERRQGQHACRTLAEYQQRARITDTELADMFEDAAHDGKCPGPCGRRFDAMPNGLADITVDRIDRRRALSRTNLAIMCLTCNRGKGVLDPKVYDIRQAVWQIRREHGLDV